MYYFRNGQHDKKLPSVGDTIFLMDIRYWETDKYKPVKADVLSVEGDSFYVYHHEYGHEVYITLTDFNWFYSYEKAILAQEYFSKIHHLISDDETEHIVNEFLDDVLPKS